MAKALGSLIVRGILGVFSIAATAIISVMVQRYFDETSQAPASNLAPDPTQVETQIRSDEMNEESNRDNNIMERFWDKLNQ